MAKNTETKKEEATEAKQVRVHINRRITLQREGKEDVVLRPGLNHVDADVAAHPFVKEHLTDAPDELVSAELEAANARIAELVEEVQALRAEIEGKDLIIKAFEATANKA